MGSASFAEMVQFLRIACFVVAGCLLFVPEANAYPWMIRHYYSGCGNCHADPSGGELLTEYGRMISEETLSMDWGGADEAEEEDGEERPFSSPFFGWFGTPEEVLLGGSMRVASLYRPALDDPLQVFPMQLDLMAHVRVLSQLRFAGSIGAARVPVGSPHARAAQVTRNQGESYNAISRTHWVAFDFGEDGVHSVRAGRLNLPFGVRMSEHVLWAREQTRTDRESDQQHGVALAMAFEKMRFEVMAIAGNYQVRPDQFRERGYSGYLEVLLGEGVMLGVSSLATRAADDRLEPVGMTSWRQAHGAMIRTRLGEGTALLAEADLLKRSRGTAGYVGFLQVDHELVRGLHLMGTAEVLDRGRPEQSNEAQVGRGQAQWGGWGSVQWFPVSHFDVRADAISRQGEPLQFMAQLHTYL